jgi:hypothetical protein
MSTRMLPVITPVARMVLSSVLSHVSSPLSVTSPSHLGVGGASSRMFGGALSMCFRMPVLYSIESDYVLFIAVMHCSREPGYWRHRAEGR